MSVRRNELVDSYIDESDTSNILSATSSRTSSNTYVCDVCGRQFPSENSLKMHKIRIHKTSRSNGEAPPNSIEINVPEVPDALSQLHSFLRMYGLSERDSQAVLRYMKSYHVDDLNRLNMALRDIGLAINRRRLLIESWANDRNIPIPPNLALELGINPTPSPSYFPEHRREDLTIFDYLLKWESLKRDVQTQPQFQTQDSQIQEIVKSYESRISELQKQIESQTKQIESLKDELNKRQIESLEKTVSELREEVKKVKEEAIANKSELSTLITTASKHLENLGEKLEDFAAFYVFRMIPTTWLEKFGLKMPEKVVEEGSKGLWEKVNEKWVSEK